MALMIKLFESFSTSIAQFPTLILKVPFLSVEIAPTFSFFVIM